ncbi:MAG: Holliday junction resolvase RuvX [Enterobacterales bacterium]|nr:Holliday junction resolvase RuvX [Enterobacterales bacterium]
MPEHTKPILAFDYGERKIGVAVGQAITESARPLDPLKAKGGQPQWQQVEELLAEWQPAVVIVGSPLNMDDSEQLLTKRAKKFGNRLHGRFGVQVEWMDERLTSVAAREELFELYGYKGLKKHSVDSLAACYILESWFNAHPS